MFLKLAFRNVFRNLRRTLFTEMAIIFGIVAIVFITGYLGGMEKLWAGRLVEGFSGHLTVIRSDYLEGIKSRPLKLTMKDSKKLYSVIESFPEVEAAVAKLDIFGLIGNGDQSTTFFGAGLDLKKIDRTLPMAYKEIIEGRQLMPSDVNGVVLGYRLAKNLRIKIGDSLLIASSTIDGQTNAIEVIVRGLIRTGNDLFDDNLAYTSLEAAQDLLAMPDRISLFNVRLRGKSDMEAVAAKLTSAIQAVEPKGVAKSWMSMNQEFARVKKINDAFSLIVGLILTFIVAMGVANTMMMSAFERTREIGTIRAIGTTNTQVIKLFCLEGLVIGTLGILIGQCLAVTLMLIVGKIGLPLPSMPGSTQALTIYPSINISYFLLITLVVFVMSIIASMYPARYASRLDPIEALRRT